MTDLTRVQTYRHALVKNTGDATLDGLNVLIVNDVDPEYPLVMRRDGEELSVNGKPQFALQLSAHCLELGEMDWRGHNEQNSTVEPF